MQVDVFAGADQGYLVTVEQLEAARTERTKVLLFVSPSNPTGAVYAPEQVKAIGEWALEHGIWVVADEIYQNLTYASAELSAGGFSGPVGGPARARCRSSRPRRGSPSRRSSSTVSPRPTR